MVLLGFNLKMRKKLLFLTLIEKNKYQKLNIHGELIAANRKRSYDENVNSHIALNVIDCKVWVMLNVYLNLFSLFAVK